MWLKFALDYSSSLDIGTFSASEREQGQHREQWDDGDTSDYLRLRDAFCAAVGELK